MAAGSVESDRSASDLGLVDITNYMTFDHNRPLHVFDADKVQGNLRVHRAKGGEKLVALDEKEYTLQPGMMVISDDKGPESIAGIMGGEETGCTEETVNVFLESAFWDHVQIALTGPCAEDQLGCALSV